MRALAVALGGALDSLGRWGIGNALRAVLNTIANVGVCLPAVFIDRRLGATIA